MRNLSFDFTGGKHDVLVLDLETQYLSHEVSGGWDSVDKFRVAVTVTWDERDGFRPWYENDIFKLFQEADRFQPIVTFNGEGFDFKVLSGYGSVANLYQKSTDLLAVLSKKLGYRVKLESLAQATLGCGKTACGTESVEWWRSGDPALRQKVADYCQMDVTLTRDLYMFGRKHGYVIVDDTKHGETRRVDVSW